MARKVTPADGDAFADSRWDDAFAALATARAALATVAADPAATTEERAIAAEVRTSLVVAGLALRPDGLAAARTLKHGASRARAALGFEDPIVASPAYGVRALETQCANEISAAPTSKPRCNAGTTPHELAAVLAPLVQVDVDALSRSLEIFAAVTTGRIHAPRSTDHRTGSRRQGVQQCACTSCTAHRIVARAIKLAT